MKINKLLFCPVVLTVITIIAGVLLSSSYIHADSSTVTVPVSITVGSACTITGGPTGESTTESNYNATINPGSLAEITGSKLTTICNDSNGYSIYATGFSGNSYDTNNTKLLSTTSSSYDINTAVAPSSPTSSTPSSWAMKLEAVQGLTPPTIETGWDAYHIVPASYTQVAEYSSSTASPSSAGATVQTKYQVYINSSQMADIYTGKVKYTIVHPYNAPTPPPTTPPISCPNPVPNLVYMQDLNSSNKAAVLASMTEDNHYYLVDNRDNKSYCVAKLKDGNIWMTQNLDLNLDASRTYTPQDTDIPASWSPVLSTYVTGTATWSNSNYNPESYDAGDLYWSGVLDDSTPVSTGDSHNHLGNYYKWTAAVAINDSSSYETQYQDINQSICPANWTLPKSGNNTTIGSFQYLVNQYGWSSYTMTNPYIWESPINASLTGSWYGSFESVGARGRFWSSVVFDNENSYRLLNNSEGMVNPVSDGFRGSGLSVRCMAR